MQKEAQFRVILQPVVEGMGFEYVGCEFVSENHQPLLRVYIDKEGGVTIDECSQVSHQLSGVLDVEEPVSNRYRLEVSSPGIERPLFTLEQYQQVVGKKLRIKLLMPLAGQGHFSGTLLKVEGELLQIMTEKGEVEIPFPSVQKAKLVYEFEKKRKP